MEVEDDGFLVEGVGASIIGDLGRERVRDLFHLHASLSHMPFLVFPFSLAILRSINIYMPR